MEKPHLDPQEIRRCFNDDLIKKQTKSIALRGITEVIDLGIFGMQLNPLAFGQN